MLTIVADIVLAVYLVLAFTTFNKPKEAVPYCSIVNIIIEDEDTNGFIKTKEIKDRLKSCHLYPIEKPMAFVDSRKIEETLKQNPFVENAECYKTQGGHIQIRLTQRLPVARVKAENGDDYYIDSQGVIMPNTKYTSDLVVVTGVVNRKYAQKVLSRIGTFIVHHPFWHSQIEQLNVLADGSIEMVPRIGDHIIYLGQPSNIQQKLDRLEKFYRYGLSEAGWNKYSYISLEFSNQIICKKKR